MLRLRLQMRVGVDMDCHNLSDAAVGWLEEVVSASSAPWTHVEGLGDATAVSAPAVDLSGLADALDMKMTISKIRKVLYSACNF